MPLPIAVPAAAPSGKAGPGLETIPASIEFTRATTRGVQSSRRPAMLAVTQAAQFPSRSYGARFGNATTQRRSSAPGTRPFGRPAGEFGGGVPSQPTAETRLLLGSLTADTLAFEIWTAERSAHSGEAAGMNRFEVELTPENENGARLALIRIDGRPLLDIVREMEAPTAAADGQPDLAGRYDYLNAADVLAPSRQLFGEAFRRLLADGDKDGDKVSVLECECGCEGCWPLLMRRSPSPRLGGLERPAATASRQLGVSSRLAAGVRPSAMRAGPGDRRLVGSRGPEVALFPVAPTIEPILDSRGSIAR